MIQVDQSCVHHWRIEPPDTDDSAGTCTLCGATRAFSNSLVLRAGYVPPVEAARRRGRDA